MQESVSTYKSSHRSDGDRSGWQQSSIGAIFADYGEAYIEQYKPYIDQIKLIRAIRVCKTPRLGGKVIKCSICDNKHYIYLSCGHSHCPICRSIQREQWVDKISNELLKTAYVHMIFTLPRELHDLAKANKGEIYSLIMRMSWATVKDVSADESNLGALPGMISVLHTFGSDMKYHIHTHNLVTFGGLDVQTGKWKSPKRKDKIAPYRDINKRYRELFLEGLGVLYRSGKIKYDKSYEEVCAMVENKNWVVHNTPPTFDTRILENYLARYINRIAISESRVKYLIEQQKVQLVYNDYRSQKEGEAAPKATKCIDPLSFIHQFMMHVLPPYFQKSRRYGLHSSATKKKHSHALKALKRDGSVIRTVMQIVTSLLGLDSYACEKCGSEKFEIQLIPQDKNWGYSYDRKDRMKPKSRGSPC